MSLDAHLIHRCSIERPGGTSVDAYGNVQQTHAPVEALIPCRLVEASQRIITPDRAQGVIVTTYTLLVGPDANVQEGDRVTVVDLGAEGYDARRFTIRSCLRRRGRALKHKSLDLEVLR